MDNLVKQHLDTLIRSQEWSELFSFYDQLSDDVKSDRELSAFSVIIMIAKQEIGNTFDGFLAKDVTLDEMISRYYEIKYAIRRVEYGINPNLPGNIVDLVNQDNKIHVTVYSIIIIIMMFSQNRQDVFLKCADIFRQNNNDYYAKMLSIYGNKIK